MVCPQDKINAFWEITKKELDDRKAELRNKDREMEEMEERHQVEIKVCHASPAPLLLQQPTLKLQTHLSVQACSYATC